MNVQQEGEMGLMSAAELLQAQQELELSNMQMARALGIRDRSYRRLIDGKRGITGPVSRVVEALRDGWRPADFPADAGPEEQDENGNLGTNLGTGQNPSPVPV
jgi:hypothetical protein